jgi:hypothetical protein
MKTKDQRKARSFAMKMVPIESEKKMMNDAKIVIATGSGMRTVIAIEIETEIMTATETGNETKIAVTRIKIAIETIGTVDTKQTIAVATIATLATGTERERTAPVGIVTIAEMTIVVVLLAPGRVQRSVSVPYLVDAAHTLAADHLHVSAIDRLQGSRMEKREKWTRKIRTLTRKKWLKRNLSQELWVCRGCLH